MSARLSSWARAALRFGRNASGAAGVYVGVMIPVLVAMVGLSTDVSRYFTTHSQAQAAADAAALAAAYQLDGQPDALVRAENAARNTPIVANDETFSENGTRTVEIVAVRFLSDLPPSDDDPLNGYYTTDPAQARFVQVWTEDLTHSNWFLVAVGAARTGRTGATAIAGMLQVICTVPPLMICNPFETPTEKGFPVDEVRGKMVLAKAQGPGASWTPGNFGFLVPQALQGVNYNDENNQNGAKRLAEELAKVAPRACYGARIDTKTGSINALRAAINVRFDIFTNPFMGGNQRRDPNYRPARNVTKGMLPSTGGQGACNPTAPDPPLATVKALPRDNCFIDGSCTQRRFGDGNWNRADYFAANHPNGWRPSGWQTMSRYEVYRAEIDAGRVPGPLRTSSIEDGRPRCYSGSTAPNDSPDRRVIYSAVVNCRENAHLLQGASGSNIPTIGFAKMFVTEPVGGGADADIWLEFVDITRPGADDGILHDIVQLYR